MSELIEAIKDAKEENNRITKLVNDVLIDYRGFSAAINQFVQNPDKNSPQYKDLAKDFCELCEIFKQDITEIQSLFLSENIPSDSKESPQGRK